VDVPLVLHGTSGLPDTMITRAVDLGVCKFNVNTELRGACLSACRAYLADTEKPELVGRVEAEIQAMQVPVITRIRLFRSAEKAS
jgi:tagatose 1,6-diphosphate aldolase GatY/KbaY